MDCMQLKYEDVVMSMRKLFVPAVLICAAVSPVHAAVDLRVTEIWMGNDPGENLTADWFEITNEGDIAWDSSVDDPLFYDDDSCDASTADQINGILSIDAGESVIVLVTDEGEGAVNAFRDLWSPVYNIENVKIGTVDGAGLGQGGDGVCLFLGGPGDGTEIDFEEYPDAGDNGGQSYEVNEASFSEAVVTIAVNDENQPAVGTPGNLGAVEIIGSIPEITLNGAESCRLTLDATFEDPGATAYDEEDGDLTDSIIVSGDIVDPSVLGEYSIQYDVTDTDGNDAATVTREVVVTHPETIPLAPAPANPDMFIHVATLADLSGSEIPAYDRTSRQAYVTSGDGLQIVDLSDVKNPAKVALIDPAESPFNLNSSAVTSVDACGEIVAFAVPNNTQTENGTVILTDSQGTLIYSVQVGALPDMVTFTDDCEKVLVANEGEPDDGVDPEGSISIIDTQTGAVKTADFTRFNGREEMLRAKGVRIFPDVAAANDFEPEYIAVSKNKRFAYVTLQEANALAVVDIKRAKVITILPLGLKDHSIPGNELDASDTDGVFNIRNRPLYGMYMPDAIAAFRKGRNQYYITANEGDARDAEVRVEDLDLDPAIFPNAYELQHEFNIGRIQVSEIDGDIDNDGDYDVLQSYGARSFSIWDRKGSLVYDSGSDIEAIVATYGKDNADDGRSDNKGPEPEGVEVGKLNKHTFAFIGLERTHQVLVYDISIPQRPMFVQMLQTEGDEAPEGLKFISKGASPNQCPTLLVTNEDSKTLSIYQLRRCAK